MRTDVGVRQRHIIGDAGRDCESGKEEHTSAVFYRGIGGNAEIIAQTSGVSQVRTSSSLPVRVIDNKAVERNEEYYDELYERQMEIYGYSDAGYDGKDQVYKSFLNGYNEEALRCLKPYIVEGDFDPENLKDNQIIVSVLRMDQRAGGGLPGPYKEGSPMMDYHAGDEIQIK